MKGLVYILSISAVLFSCKKQEAKIELAAEKLYIISINNHLPEYGPNGEEDSTYMQIHGLAAIDKDFKTEVINREGHTGPFLSWNTKISDSIKSDINRIIVDFSTDTLCQEEPRSLYDGPIYLLLIEKEKGKYVRVGLSPWGRTDLLNISRLVFEEHETSGTKHLGTNQDSIKSILRGFEKYVFDVYKPPPPPMQIKVKFKRPKANF